MANFVVDVIAALDEARTFRDLEGTLWIVHEVAGEALGGGPTSLLLVSPQQLRRVSVYPAEWPESTARAAVQLALRCPATSARALHETL